jgi:ABC-type antimicrobial peptide transport system permease subunit
VLLDGEDGRELAAPDDDLSRHRERWSQSTAETVLGVYGVLSSAVAQQTQEVGVRMAVGASPGAVFRMVVARGARLLLAGLAVGLAGSYYAVRTLEAYVWNASTFDLLTFGAVSVLLLIAGLQACAWPAWRASRVSPVVALRTE